MVIIAKLDKYTIFIPLIWFDKKREKRTQGTSQRKENQQKLFMQKTHYANGAS